MYGRPILIPSLLAVLLAVPHSPVPLTAQGEAVTAFLNVNVVPMDRERVLENQTVVVRGDRIVALGPAATTRVPAGATRIEARGKYLLPGLAEMHAHIPPPQAGDSYVERVLFLYVANGVTTVRGMLGHPAHLELRERVMRGEVVGPTIYTSGPSFSGSSAPDPATARRMVIEQKEAGYDFLKIHPGLSRETFDALARTADSVGIRFAGHVPADVGLRRALGARYASIDHLDGYVEYLARDHAPAGPTGFFGFSIVEHADESQLEAVARATREARVWNVPTQALMEGFASPDDPDVMGRRPEMRYMPPQIVAQWVRTKRNFQSQDGYTAQRARQMLELRGKIIKALHDAGAGLVLGSDAPQVMNVPGFSVHRELQTLVAAGLTPYQALVTGTRNVAAYFGTLDRGGTVEAGKVADLILLEANPLADVATTARRAGVMVRGRWLPEAAIRERLERYASEGGS